MTQKSAISHSTIFRNYIFWDWARPGFLNGTGRCPSYWFFPTSCVLWTSNITGALLFTLDKASNWWLQKMDATCGVNGMVQYKLHCELLGHVCVNLEGGIIPYKQLMSKRFICILLLTLMLLLNNTVIMYLACYMSTGNPACLKCLPYCTGFASMHACTHTHMHVHTHINTVGQY